MVASEAVFRGCHGPDFVSQFEPLCKRSVVPIKHGMAMAFGHSSNSTAEPASPARSASSDYADLEQDGVERGRFPMRLNPCMSAVVAVAAVDLSTPQS